MKKNIILIGYMGSGKSAVGREIASSNSMKYIDLDDYIEEREGKSIATIFKTKGEIYFRKKETAYLNELINKNNNLLLSLGGGTPCFGNNINVVNTLENGISIYLQTSIAELSKRLFAERSKRPLIAHTKDKEELSEFIAKHIFERAVYYNQANYTVKTDGKPIADIASKIINIVNTVV